MGKRMLIDASHPEESRVAILNNDRLEEFDFETTTKKQLKGNIYLAKVIRIEPSLQAAFVEFGGNRHGFLAFNEIHPDYYRIPVEDREALLAQEVEEIAIDDTPEEPQLNDEVEILGGEDVEEIQERPKRPRPLRQYKIQEVIKRRQIMLVQVVKEERGGKGAALTTYLSLAGRYCVLMPNAAKGGGISRKITSLTDRKRLHEIIESMDLPPSMSLIIRTAGMARSKIEIKRDCDYLMHLWNDIREKTLHSIAPCLIYEESDLIKRAIRDYYTRDIDEISIEGEAGYKEAKDFIRKLMPSHTKKVNQYSDEKMPLFYRYDVERQIDAMHNPVIQLKSGGYIVFGTTEALVAIDVNSGKATRERHIEETAFKTNLEAAEEIARQLRLRDLAGLVVIDFIDMDESRNIEAIERRLKDAMRYDRARVQVGRISPFGLLELSRQRLRPNIIESTSLPCVACRGTGMIRSVESSSLHVLRGIEEEAIQQKTSEINVYVPTSIALYILNQKRNTLESIESKWNISIHFSRDDNLIPPDYRIERLRSQRESSLRASSDLIAEEQLETFQLTSLPSTKREQRYKTGKNRLGGRRRQDKRFPKHGLQPSVSPSTPLENEGVIATNNDMTSPSSSENETLSPDTRKMPSRGKSHRRYRKFERKPSRRREGPYSPDAIREDSATPPHSPSFAVAELKKEELSLMSSIRAKTIDKASDGEKKKANTSSPPSEQKKASARKGWWQRLLE